MTQRPIKGDELEPNEYWNDAMPVLKVFLVFGVTLIVVLIGVALFYSSKALLQ